MTPAELIEAALRKDMRIRPQERAIDALKSGEPILVTGGEAAEGARIAVDALAGAGLVVVPAEDLRVYVTEEMPDFEPEGSGMAIGICPACTRAGRGAEVTTRGAASLPPEASDLPEAGPDR